MLEVGAVLTRKADGASVRLVGVDGAGRWVCQLVDEFGPSFAVEVGQLVEDYEGVRDPSPPPALDEAALREADVRANDEAARAMGRANAHREPRESQRAGAEALATAAGADHLLSPEEQFAALAEAEAEAEDGN